MLKENVIEVELIRVEKLVVELAEALIVLLMLNADSTAILGLMNLLLGNRRRYGH